MKRKEKSITTHYDYEQKIYPYTGTPPNSLFLSIVSVYRGLQDHSKALQ